MEGRKKYQIDTEENKDFLKGQLDELIKFGRHFPAPDGTAYWLGPDGSPWKDRNRETYETARMAHVYCLGSMLGYEGSRELAEKAVGALRNSRQRDSAHGGWFSAITPEGEGIGPKLCYVNAFVILAASSGIQAGIPGSEELLREAEDVFDRYFWEEEPGLAADTWSTDFTRLDSYRGINANMHTTEAFLAAADSKGDERYRDRAGSIIRHVIGWAEANDWRIPEHYTENWEPDLFCNQDKKSDPFKPYGATPGHGIEWSRLILQYTLSEKENTKEKQICLDAAQHLFRRAVQDGWNVDGAPGIVYTTDWDGTPVVHDRMHWTLAEGINTSAVLFHQTGDRFYSECFEQFLAYLDEKVIDHEKGSWFHQLDRTNCVMDTVWPGKPDLYHAVQAMIIPYANPTLSVAAVLKQK